MSKKLLLATRNTHKQLELKEILSGLDIEVITLDEVLPLPEVEEDGETLVANAIKKAKTIALLSGHLTLADDSGLMVDILDGQPGVYSARFAGEDADDARNNEKLLRVLRGIEESLRTARFKCVIAICTPEGKTETVEGTCEGKIALEPTGEGGFGYDPLFIPAGFTRSFAELSADEKNNMSHRGQALQKARPIIEKLCER